MSRYLELVEPVLALLALVASVAVAGVTFWSRRDTDEKPIKKRKAAIERRKRRPF